MHIRLRICSRHVYGALCALDALTGATTFDDILHQIFSTYCIGK